MVKPRMQCLTVDRYEREKRVQPWIQEDAAKVVKQSKFLRIRRSTGCFLHSNSEQAS